jgi:hypothetical protein
MLVGDATFETFADEISVQSGVARSKLRPDTLINSADGLAPVEAFAVLRCIEDVLSADWPDELIDAIDTMVELHEFVLIRSGYDPQEQRFRWDPTSTSRTPA